MAAEIGSSVAGKAIDSLFDHVQRELGYLLCFNNNIQDLETRLGELIPMRNDVQGREDEAKRMYQITLGETVIKWIEDANTKIAEAENVINEKAELQKGCFSIKWCPNLKLRFSLGKKGKKLSLLLVDLLRSGKDHLPQKGLALPMPTIDMSNYNGDASDFDSRKKIVEEIIKMLGDKETRLIGICGMGGIGKTTLAKQVLQKVHDLFDSQVISIVSRPPNFNAIQQQVVEGLKGPSLKEIENEIERAERLRNAFNNKKVVVLLDDVWGDFDLNAKGFPIKESEDCCKIIYTSRNQGLWSGYRTIRKKEISLDELSSEESWNLFIRKVDLRDDDNDFHSKNEIARKIVDECKGLPLVLEVAGGALIKKSEHEWHDMLVKLQRQHEHDSKKVQKVLETSYDCLEDPIAKNIFLLCCLFPEDSLIPIETLYRYAMGLQLFEGTMNDVYDIRNRVYSLVNDLIMRNLLINVQEDLIIVQKHGRVVKMHDVLRDVGLSIAKQEEKDINVLICDHGVNQLQNYVMGPNTKMISILFLKSGLKFPDDVMEFRGSNLELLLLESFYRSDTKIPWNLFQGTDDLKVLDISGPCVISEFPHSSPFPYLSKLKMLSLEYMDLNLISNLSFIQHLTCLEILSFRSSYNMEVLPNEIGELRNLKVFDLTNCWCFINNGILSKLTNLQELWMWDSFEDWKTLKEEDIISTTGKDNNAAKLIELDCLDKLRKLELFVPKIDQVPRNVRLFSPLTLLKQFKIRIGERRRRDQIKFESSERSQLWVEMENDEDSVNLFYALGVLIENGITSLRLHNESMWEQMYLNRYLSALKDIILGHCESIITLFVPSKSSSQISQIEETNRFGHLLWRIEIYECNQMRHLCSTSIFTHLKKLKVLVLKKCERLEEVVSISNSEEELEKIVCNTLEILELCEMDQLTCFCRGIHEIYFHGLKSLKLKGLKSFIFPKKMEIPQLKHMKIISIPSIITLCNIVAPSLQKLKIDHCDNLKYIPFSNSLMMENIILKHCKSIITLFVPSKSSPQIFSIEETNGFGHILWRIEIYECNQMSHLCSTSIFTHLKKLKGLVLKNCKRMEEVVSISNSEEEQKIVCNTLEILELCEMDQLTYFCKGINEIYFHGLKSLKLKRLKSFIFPTKIEIPQLKHMEIISIPSIISLCNIVAPSLQELKIDHCDNFEYISFSNSKEEIEKIDFNILETLELCEMDQLTCFCRGINEIYFHRLKSLKLKGLKSFIFPTKMEIPQLKHMEIISIPSIITLCNIVAPSLQELKIDHCDNFEYISFSNSKEEIEKIDFNILETLELYEMDQLTCFCRGINEIYFHRLKSLTLKGLKSFIFPTKMEIPQLKHMEIISLPSIITLCNIVAPSLQELKIDDCDNLNYIFISNSIMVKNIVHLQKLTITKCKLLKGIIVIIPDTEEQRQISIKFSNLMKLQLECLDKLASFIIHDNHLGDEEENDEKPPNALFYCDEDQVSLPCLQELRLRELSKINYIIGWKDRYCNIQEGYDKKILQPFFPNLKRLELAYFGELMSFVGFINTIGGDNSEKQNALFYLDDQVSFPCLKRLEINGLPYINYIVGCKGRGEDNNDYDKTPLIFPILKILIVGDLSNLIHMYESNHQELGVLLFQNVSHMRIYRCEKLRYLFSENIGRVATEHLVLIDIFDCPMMEVVMKNEEDEEELGAEDYKAKAEREGINCHLFPLLENLHFFFLPVLRRFCDVAYTWTLPSLRHVTVSKCPKLEALSPGYLDSPSLYRIMYDDISELVKNRWKGDVNAALRDIKIIMEEEKKKREEEMEEEREMKKRVEELMMTITDGRMTRIMTDDSENNDYY